MKETYVLHYEQKRIRLFHAGEELVIGITGDKPGNVWRNFEAGGKKKALHYDQPTRKDPVKVTLYDIEKGRVNMETGVELPCMATFGDPIKYFGYDK